MSIFPFIDPQEVEISKKEIPLAREYAFDFEKCEFKLKNGKMYIVEGKEALKIWIYKALITQRFKEIIFTWDFGSELEDKIVGKGYTKGLIRAEAERYTREAINTTLSDYVINLKDFKVDFIDSTLKIDFIAETIYGEVDMNVQQ